MDLFAQMLSAEQQLAQSRMNLMQRLSGAGAVAPETIYNDKGRKGGVKGNVKVSAMYARYA